MIPNQINIKGLSDTEVSKSRDQYGNNSIKITENRVLWHALKEVVFEPMFILLLAACLIYFFVGQFMEGIIMLVSIFIVVGIFYIRHTGPKMQYRH
jgi:Ca2+-transporting ATPase